MNSAWVVKKLDRKLPRRNGVHAWPPASEAYFSDNQKITTSTIDLINSTDK